VRIADNHAAIRDRSRSCSSSAGRIAKGGAVRDWKHDEDDPDRNLVEQVKKILGRGRLRD
jgi:hypothetical protein